ncbi:MAG: hypothetical protein MMC33_001850 [Icmadophila ericetorum]|nr:hypothetical protein [Icmadophila ericetorum]
MDEGNSGKRRASSADGSSDRKDETMANRIGTSASKLLKSTILQPTAIDVSSALASSSSSASKGESSSSRGYQPASEEGSKEHNAHLVSQGLHQDDGTVLKKESFRSQPSDLAQSEFDAFTAQNSSVGDPHTLYQEIVPHSSVFEAAQQASFQGPSRLSESQNINHRDGEEVVNLLANPEFVLEYAPPVADDLDSESHFEDLFDVPSSTPISSRQLGTASRSNSLSFVPKFEASYFSVKGEKHASATTPIEEVNVSTLKHCGGYEELDPWIDVLTRYHDEVWGSHLPLVQKAREEIKEAMNGTNAQANDFAALRRLAMVLGHFERRSNV